MEQFIFHIFCVVVSNIYWIVGPGEAKISIKNLSCYSCTLGIEHNINSRHNCLIMENRSTISQKPCLETDQYCRVRFLKVKKSDGNVSTRYFSRDCSKECYPGCVSAGDVMRLTMCSSCCQNPLCNTDNDAHAILPASVSSLLISFFGIILLA